MVFIFLENSYFIRWRNGVLITRAWEPDVALPWWSMSPVEWTEMGGCKATPCNLLFIVPATPIWQRILFSLCLSTPTIVSLSGQSPILSYPTLFKFIRIVTFFLSLQCFRSFESTATIPPPLHIQIWLLTNSFKTSRFLGLHFWISRKARRRKKDLRNQKGWRVFVDAFLDHPMEEIPRKKRELPWQRTIIDA